MPKFTARKRKSTGNRSIKNRRKGGGIFDLALGTSRIRSGRYEFWLEERLALYFDDIEFVKKVKAKFGYDKTAIYSFDLESVKTNCCKRKPEDKALILGDKLDKICSKQ